MMTLFSEVYMRHFVGAWVIMTRSITCDLEDYHLVVLLNLEYYWYISAYLTSMRYTSHNIGNVKYCTIFLLHSNNICTYLEFIKLSPTIMSMIRLLLLLLSLSLLLLLCNERTFVVIFNWWFLKSVAYTYIYMFIYARACIYLHNTYIFKCQLRLLNHFPYLYLEHDEQWRQGVKLYWKWFCFRVCLLW